MRRYYKWNPKTASFVMSPKPLKKRKIKVIYRLAKNIDKDALLEFELECFKTETEVFPTEPDFEERKKVLSSIDLDKQKNFAVIIALANNRIVGQLSMGWYFNYDTNCQIGVIPGLWVLKSYRMAGVGRGLVDFAKDEFRKRKVKDIELIVGLNNLAAQEFYKRLGFEIKRVGLGVLNLQWGRSG